MEATNFGYGPANGMIPNVHLGAVPGSPEWHAEQAQQMIQMQTAQAEQNAKIAEQYKANQQDNTLRDIGQVTGSILKTFFPGQQPQQQGGVPWTLIGGAGLALLAGALLWRRMR